MHSSAVYIGDLAKATENAVREGSVRNLQCHVWQVRFQLSTKASPGCNTCGFMHCIRCNSIVISYLQRSMADALGYKALLVAWYAHYISPPRSEKTVSLLIVAASTVEASANLCLTGDCLAHVSPRPERTYCRGHHRLSTARALAATCGALSSATARHCSYQTHGHPQQYNIRHYTYTCGSG